MSAIKTQTQVSAGGVVFREHEGRVEIVLISVGNPPRWQLPKGIVEADEAPETTALREVREEAGVEAALIGPLHTVEYWYVSTQHGRRVRYHKFVHFYLMRYTAGDVRDHDHEVREARWLALDEALQMLTFANERQVVENAREAIEEANHGN
jgi:8-oxo-dGTP pyrophosphatase MutT (NUDIX family)